MRASERSTPSTQLPNPSTPIAHVGFMLRLSEGIYGEKKKVEPSTTAHHQDRLTLSSKGTPGREQEWERFRVSERGRFTE